MKTFIKIAILTSIALAYAHTFGMEKPRKLLDSMNLTISNQSDQNAVVAIPTGNEDNPIKLVIIKPLAEYNYGYVDRQTKALFYIATLTNKYKIIYSDKPLDTTPRFSLKGQKPHFLNLQKLSDHGLPQTRSFQQKESFNTMILIQPDGLLTAHEMCDEK